MNGMREHFGNVALLVSVFVHTITEVIIAVIANMLPIHTLVLTRHLLIALVAPEVAVIIVAIGYLLITFIAIMLGRVLVSTVDDSATTIAIVVLVLVYMVTN